MDQVQHLARTALARNDRHLSTRLRCSFRYPLLFPNSTYRAVCLIVAFASGPARAD